jgi:hypothetical protein
MHDTSTGLSQFLEVIMKQYSPLRFAAFALLMASTAAYATPGTITPERNGNGQQTPTNPYPYPNHGDQNGQQDDDYQNGQDQNQDDGYQDDQGDQGQQQDDDWGNDDKDQGDHWNHDDGKDQGNHDGKNQGDDGWDKDGRDQGKHHQHHQRRYVETVPVRQQFLGMARLPLYMLTNNLMNLQGARLTGIVINGYSQAGMGGAFFCSSYCSAIQSVGGYPSSYYIQATGEPINQFSGQWFLELRGNFAIDSIQLQFMR